MLLVCYRNMNEAAKSIFRFIIVDRHLSFFENIRITKAGADEKIDDDDEIG